eukprot:g7434.t1
MVLDAWEELLGSAVRKKVIVEGAGDVPDFGSVVVFSWTGSELIDGMGRTAFCERKRATARIGDGDEIPAVELGLRHMRLGEQCIIRCESRFAYGPDGCPATKEGHVNLPPDSDIEVRIELLGVQSTKPVPDMSPEETVAEGARKKVVGNGHFERAAYKKALRTYTSAANIVAEMEFPNENAEAFREARQLRIDCGNNIATTYVRLGDLEKAKEAAVGVLELDPDNAKALFRAGQVSSLQSNFTEASLALKRAIKVNPASKEIQAELQMLSARVKAYKKKRQAMEESMARNLFAGPKAESVDREGTGNDAGVGDAAGHASREEPVCLADKRKLTVLLGARPYQGVLGCVVVALIAYVINAYFYR